MNGAWVAGFDAFFLDIGALLEVMSDASIEVQTIADWRDGELDLMGQGVVRFGNKVGSLQHLGSLLGNHVALQRGVAPHEQFMPDCVGHPACTFGGTGIIQMYDSAFNNASLAPQIIVHELAHVIDYASGGVRGQSFPQGNPVTNYARGNFREFYAESVGVWVYGDDYYPNAPGRDVLDPRLGLWLSVDLSIKATTISPRRD